VLPGCKKGNRECVYPEKTTATKSSNNKPATRASQESLGSSSEEYEDDEETERLKAIPDEVGDLDDNGRPSEISASGVVGVDVAQSLSHRTSFTRRGSETPSLVHDKGSSPSPSSEGSICYSVHSGTLLTTPKGQKPNISLGPEVLRNDWSHLPQDLQFYLNFFCENITCDHYAMKHDSGDFLRTYFLDTALRHEALLYAVVGFSAFQYTLTNPRGRMQDFLQYYNKAVSLLLKSLTRGERHNLGILLTMLQLATIEVSILYYISR
jgi:Fungal specific transcription factor domain